MQAYVIPSRAVEGPGYGMGLKLGNKGALAVKTGWVPGAGTYKPSDEYSSMNKTKARFSI